MKPNAVLQIAFTPDKTQNVIGLQINNAWNVIEASCITFDLGSTKNRTWIEYK